MQNIDNAEKSEILTRDIKLESGVEAIVADIIKNVFEYNYSGGKVISEMMCKKYKSAFTKETYMLCSLDSNEILDGNTPLWEHRDKITV